MADTKKISELPPTTSPLSTDVFPVVTAGVTSKSSIQTLATTIQAVQPYGSSVSRTLQDKLRDTVSVSDFGAVGDGVADDTAAITAAMTAAVGRILHFDKPSATYLTGQLVVPSDITLVFEPGITMQKKLNGNRILYLLNVQNVIIYGNGVWLQGDDLPGTTSSGHTILINGSKKCVLHDVNVNGSGAYSGSKDCIYIGKGTGPCEDITIIGGICKSSKRNAISVISAKRTVIDGVELTDNHAAPGAGIDIEANGYDEVSDTLIQNCHVHHNYQGVLGSFGIRTTVRNCHIHDNDTFGVLLASAGAVHAEYAYRPNVDIRGISAIDIATGVISVGGSLADLPVGTPVQFAAPKNGGVNPSVYAASRYIVSRHVAPNGVVLGTSVGFGEVTSLVSAGSGVLSADPTVADIRLLTFAIGQGDGGIVDNNTIHNNGGNGVYCEGSGMHRISRNRVYDNSNNQIQATYTQNIFITDNHIYCTPAHTPIFAGIAANSSGNELQITGNVIENTRGQGIKIDAWTGAKIDRNRLWNCGANVADGRKAHIYLVSGIRMLVAGNNIRQSETNTTTLYGIYSESTNISNCTFRDNNLTQAGISNINSYFFSSATGHTMENNRMFDGTMYMTGSAVYDPASLADGAGVTTNVTCFGAETGDFVEASFSISLAGVTLTASPLFSNTVAVRFQNESGGVVDLGSGTIKVRARR